ncbi:hypothetical protein TNCV_2411731 [Trichonephila clavipes]|nr:hypothetical protein TNCV_2411731 [Trichonephila clavipes]
MPKAQGRLKTDLPRVFQWDFLVTLIQVVRRCHIAAHENRRDKGLVVRLSLAVAFEHQAGDSMVWLRTVPMLKENTFRGAEAYCFSSPSTNLTRGLAARKLFPALS